MKVRAPGKLVLTGAYAVLDGAPAVVAAVDRYAVADAAALTAEPLREVRVALGAPAPLCDTSALEVGGRKLGLGSSAAALVAAVAADELSRRPAEAALDDALRHRIFDRSRRAHAEAQGGGSGVDVAAATYGGVLRYALMPNGAPTMLALALPSTLVLRVYFAGSSARTSDMLAGVAAFHDRDPQTSRAHRTGLGVVAAAAADAFAGASAGEVVAAVRAFGEALEAFGDAAQVPIVPASSRRLAERAAAEGAWFLPAGAGGGDVGVFFGIAPPSAAFHEEVATLGFTEVPLAVGAPGVAPLGLEAQLPGSGAEPGSIPLKGLALAPTLS